MFSGIDGLGLAVQLATCGRMAWHAEVDPAACTVLARHWRCPNLGDVSAIDWDGVEPVGVLVGGFPCQDISLAGKGAGIDGERSGLWREIVRAVRALRPALVFVENVSALLARGFDRVAADLAACGYRFAWSVYSSADIGAPHRRQRLFILATPDADSGGLRQHAEQWLASGWAPRGVRDEGRAVVVNDGEDADTACTGRQGRHEHQPQLTVARRPATDRHGDGRERLAALDRAHVRVDEQPRHDVDGRGAGTGEVPGSDQCVGAGVGSQGAAPVHRLNPAFVEWMMGFSEGWTDGVSRRARLRLLGNSVQPQTAQAAFLGLLGRLCA
jgi:DNA (cytosine-5)-methyltransferase 1